MKEVYTKDEILTILFNERRYLRDMCAKICTNSEIIEHTLIDINARIMEINLIISVFAYGEE